MMDKYKVDWPEGARGLWRVERFTVPKHSIEGMRLGFAGRGISPGTYTRLMHKHRGLVMSDTPAEIRDCMSLFINARGNGLINGLGLGMCLRGVLLKPEVEQVTVIEIDQDLIDLIGGYFADKSRVAIINADAFHYKPPRGQRFDFVWHDIWDDICGDNYDEMKRLHRKYGRLTKWQESWCRWQTQRAAKEQ